MSKTYVVLCMKHKALDGKVKEDKPPVYVITNDDGEEYTVPLTKDKMWKMLQGFVEDGDHVWFRVVK